MNMGLPFSHIIPLFLISIICVELKAQTLAFPGAEGFGRYTTGGRGGDVYAVTSLNDSGPGSFREAVSKSGPRTIVFRVSGQIHLTSSLTIRNGDLTIAGQTAPGGGIVISGQQVTIDARNVIIRFVRFRLGDSNQVEADAVSSRYGEDIIIDHCTFSWGVDEVMSMYLNRNTTFQWNIVSESLNRSTHAKGDHGYGGIWGGANASFHHNLIAHHKSRTPRFNGARYEANWNEHVDFRNNVIYNWGDNNIYGAEPSDVDGNKANYNIVNNYYKYGPATGSGSKRYRIISPDDQGQYGYSNFYIDGNYVHGYPEVTADNWNGGVQNVSEAELDEMKAEEPFDFHMESDHSAEEAFELVLANAGAVFPYRDEVDQRIAAEVASGTATYGGQSYGNGIIDSQDDVGGYPDLPSGTAPDDTDGDGIPDNWELENDLDPEDVSDGPEDADGDGYTNLEEYLNELVESTVISNIDVLATPTGLTISVDEEVQNSVTISWNPLGDEGAVVVVERAMEENNEPGEFEEVASVANDTSYHEYVTVEENARVYYRVKSVLDDAESLYSNTVNALVAPATVTGLSVLKKHVLIYPNPVLKSIEWINISSKDEIAAVSIMDLAGNEVQFKETTLKELKVQTSGWRPGCYIVSIYFRNGNVKITKVIKR